MNILLVEDDVFVREALSSYLRDIGHSVTEAKDGQSGLSAAEQKDYELVISDVCMPRMGGIELLQKIREDESKIMDVILMTGNDDVEMSRHDAISQGAFEYIRKPEDPDELNDILNRVSEDIATRLENQKVEKHYREVMNISEEAYKEKLQLRNSALDDVFLHSSNVKSVFRDAEKLGTNMNVPVVIEGPIGVGKELLAKFIHYNSPRKNSPFLIVNCSSIPPELFEKELFGYEVEEYSTRSKGGRRGKMELVGDGTILFKNVEDLPSDMQLRLLHVLKSKTFYRANGSCDIPFRARVVVCSRVSLEKEVLNKSFHEGLFDELNIGSLALEALQERRDEIIPLAKDFLSSAKSKYGEVLPMGYNPDTIEFLRKYPWNGNIRELKNAVERVVLMEDSRFIRPEQFRFLAKTDIAPEKQENAEPVGNTLENSTKKRFFLPKDGIDLDNFILDIVQQAYKMSDGNKSAAANLLGISPWSFSRKFKKMLKKK